MASAGQNYDTRGVFGESRQAMRETGTRQAPATLSEDLLDHYAEGWIERGRLAAARQAEWREAVRNRLPALVSLLVERFEVTRITLFGSFARGSAVPGSDIDLLVDGLSDDRLIEATVAAERLFSPLPITVDLVPVHRARSAVRERAEQEGECLYD